MIGEPIGAAPIGASASTAPPPIGVSALDAVNTTEATGVTTPLAFAYPADSLSTGEVMFAGDVYYALIDALSMSDSISATVFPTLRDAALILDAAVATVQRGASLSDALRLTEALRLAYDAAISEAITATTVDDVNAYKVALIAERVLASGLVSGYQQAYAAAIASVAVIALAGSHYFEGALVDAVDAVDNLLGVLLVLADMADEATFADTILPSVRMTAVFADSATTSSTVTPQAVMTQLFDDALGVTIAMSFGGEEFVGFMLNAGNKAASSYTNYPFNSLAQFDGRYFGMADDGLYELVGTTDNGAQITATLRTGLMNFGTSAFKSLPAVYVGAKTDGTFVFKVTTTSETGSKRQYWYTSVARTANAVREHRITPGKGLSSVYWQFELETVDGADLLLDTLALVPMTLNRKV